MFVVFFFSLQMMIHAILRLESFLYSLLALDQCMFFWRWIFFDCVFAAENVFYPLRYFHTNEKPFDRQLFIKMGFFYPRLKSHALTDKLLFYVIFFDVFARQPIGHWEMTVLFSFRSNRMKWRRFIIFFFKSQNLFNRDSRNWFKLIFYFEFYRKLFEQFHWKKKIFIEIS